MHVGLSVAGHLCSLDWYPNHGRPVPLIKFPYILTSNILRSKKIRTQLRYVLSVAKTTHSHKTWAEVSSSAPHSVSQPHYIEQCFSTFVRPRPGKFLFYKTRARSQQIIGLQAIFMTGHKQRYSLTRMLKDLDVWKISDHSWILPRLKIRGLVTDICYTDII
jgi:hypothetical protein